MAFNSELARKRGETIEDIFKRLLPHGKPDCTTHLQEKETIEKAIDRIATSKESYKMYWILTEKSKGINQETYHARELAKDHAKILTSKAQTALNRALRLLALESNLEEGSMEHSMANSRAKRKIRTVMSYEVLWVPTKKQTQDSEPTGNLAELSDKNRSTMEDGMPKLTKAGQLQIMQGKSVVIIKLQRELQKDIQDYKLANLQYLLTEPDQAIPKHNKGAKLQVEDVVLWERVPPGPGVPHTM